MYIFHECKRKRQRLHELRIARSKRLRTISSSTKCIYNLNDCSCALACPAGGASGRAWFFWFFLHQGKKNRITVMFWFYFLLLAQKKVTKKSAPPMMYGHWRTPWLSFGATV